eukprot:766681-Hanusia_phi.AAC.6
METINFCDLPDLSHSPFPSQVSTPLAGLARTSRPVLFSCRFTLWGSCVCYKAPKCVYPRHLQLPCTYSSTEHPAGMGGDLPDVRTCSQRQGTHVFPTRSASSPDGSTPVILSARRPPQETPHMWMRTRPCETCSPAAREGAGEHGKGSPMTRPARAVVPRRMRTCSVTAGVVRGKRREVRGGGGGGGGGRVHLAAG